MTREEISEQFGITLERTRMKLNLSQQAMAEKLDMSLSSYKHLIDGSTTRVELYTAHRLHELTGMLISEMLGDLSAPGAQIVEAFNRLTPEQRRFINGMISFENEFLEKEPPEQVECNIPVLVPTGNAEDGMIYDSANVIHVNAAVYKHQLGDQIHCGILVGTNHLHPVYNAGDVLLVSKRPMRDGDTGIFFNRRSGRVYIRRYRQTEPCRLEPLNDYGEPILVDPHNPRDMAQWIKYGVVLTKMRASIS